MPTKNNTLKFTEACQILNQMHFGACVIRSGRSRGTKKIWWTSLEGKTNFTPFVRETTWEHIIEFAKQQLPVWDKAWLFEVGDVIEFDWFYKMRSRGIILERDESIQSYVIQSEAFRTPTGGRSDRRRLTNYDLKFAKNAIKIGEVGNGQCDK